MGVHGLWRLIEPSGKPVPLETLENKVLAVDVSIWLHQLVKGFQDSKGAPLPNAHLLGIYHRVCKLLYFRIKPVFVFDGGVPVLKKQTIAKRNQQKQKTLSEADRIHKNLLSTLLKHSAISKVLSEKAKAAITASTSPTKKTKRNEDDLYKLPPPSSSLDSTLSSSIEEEEEESSSEDSHAHSQYDLHSIDTESVQFKSLPVEMRHEILTDLKETRKQSSWGRIHELPTESDDFSGYQMRRLLKRQSVQSALEEAEKEMGGHSLSLGELEKILKDQGVITNNQVKGSRIASDENTRFLLIKDVKQAIEDAKKQNKLATIAESASSSEDIDNTEARNKGDKQFEDDLQKAIALSLEQEPSTSKQSDITSEEIKAIGRKGKNRMPLSFLSNFDEADFDDSESSEEEIIQTKFTSAQKYMIENSTLTTSQIAKLIASKAVPNKKNTIEDRPVISEKSVHQKSSKEIIDVPEEQEKNNTDIETIEDRPIISEKSVHQKTSKEIIDVPEEQEKNTTDIETIDISEEEEASMADNNEKESEPRKDASEPENLNVEMSDSESSTCDDFLDVDDTKKEEVTTTTSMEVVIKPDEEMEDDLFKDIFSNQEKTSDADSVQLIADKIEEPLPIEMIHTENVQLEADRIGESASENKEESVLIQEKSVQTGNLKDKIEKMIKQYSRPKDQENTNSPLSVEQLNEMRDNLRQEEAKLVEAKSSKERVAGNITEQMYQEAQELLELFGVPYLTAPMEAEAQCAFLELINLTDGTITDDSDIWLFGGRTVYKNFFNQSKTVLEFKAESIQHHYKLTREQMILLAMLVGSDYTVGLSGVGPVTALEILAAFPPKNQLISGLAEFKAWFNKGKVPGLGRVSLRSKLRNLKFSENFPNQQIIQAYLEPQVEKSDEKFTWSKPDVVGLVDFARQKFGWAKVKTEEILKPILKRLEEHSQQKSILDYFKRDYAIDSGNTENKMSKRVQNAIDRIGKANGEEEPEPKRKKQKSLKGEAASTSAKRRQTKKEDGQETKAEAVTTAKKRQTKRVDEEQEEPKGKAADTAKRRQTKKVAQQETKGETVTTAKKRQTKKVDEGKEPKGEAAGTAKKIDEEPKGESVGTTKKRQIKKVDDELKETTSKKRQTKKTKSIDEDIQILKETEARSQVRVEEIEKEVHKQIEEQNSKKVNLTNLHKREVIPQRQREKSDMLRNKLKAIETFRKSKQGPGYVKKRGKIVKAPQQDASYLSESDSD